MAPPTTEIVTATNPICTEVREPQITRLRLSRPNESVPIGYQALGGWSASTGLIAFGLNGEMIGAASAIRTIRQKITSPAMAARLRRKRRRAELPAGRPRCATTSVTVTGDVESASAIRSPYQTPHACYCRRIRGSITAYE